MNIFLDCLVCLFFFLGGEFFLVTFYNSFLHFLLSLINFNFFIILNNPGVNVTKPFSSLKTIGNGCFVFISSCQIKNVSSQVFNYPFSFHYQHDVVLVLLGCREVYLMNS